MSFCKVFFLSESGIISANVNLSGKSPVLKFSLESFYKIGAVELSHFWTIFAGISFLELAFFKFKLEISLSTSVSISLNKKLLLAFWFI